MPKRIRLSPDSVIPSETLTGCLLARMARGEKSDSPPCVAESRRPVGQQSGGLVRGAKRYFTTGEEANILPATAAMMQDPLWQDWLERLYNLRRDKRGSHERPGDQELAVAGEAIDHELLAMPHPEPEQAGQPLELPSFGTVEADRVLAQDDLFAVVRDNFPVAPGHTLIIARRPVERFRELTATEKARLVAWVDWAQEHLQATLAPAPDGFNLGVNDGKAAGQTMPQFHFHVIPRCAGDVPDPRGGIRCVIAANARYW